MIEYFLVGSVLIVDFLLKIVLFPISLIAWLVRRR